MRMMRGEEENCTSMYVWVKTHEVGVYINKLVLQFRRHCICKRMSWLVPHRLLSNYTSTFCSTETIIV